MDQAHRAPPSRTIAPPTKPAGHARSAITAIAADMCHVAFGKTRARLLAPATMALSVATTLTSGRADPPPSGQAVNFLEPMVVCRKHRELKELVEALRISLKAYDAKLKQLGVDRSECDCKHGWPRVCC